MNMLTLMNEIFHYDFMRNAFLAGTIAAICASIIGYFIVLRGQSFAGHALSHISFTGAAGAGLIGLSPPIGQLFLTLLAAIGMGSLGERTQKSDVAIGVVLAFALGLGILFLYLYTDYAGRAMTILFGDLLGVSLSLIKTMLIFGIISLIGLTLIARPLLFASLDPELAEAKGVPLHFISISFLSLVAIAITEASQVVGILLVFTLLIGPAASAIQLSKSFWFGILLSMVISLIITWGGILSSYISNWPVSFWISAFSLLSYLIARFYQKYKHYRHAVW